MPSAVKDIVMRNPQIGKKYLLLMVATSLLAGCQPDAPTVKESIKVAEVEEKIPPSGLCPVGLNSENIPLSLSSFVSERGGVSETYVKNIVATGENSEEVALDLNESSLNVLSLSLSYTSDQAILTKEPTSPTSPRMPLLGPNLALYAYPGEIHIRDLEGSATVGVVAFPPDEPVNIAVLGCTGTKGFLYVNDEFAGVLSRPFKEGKWILGKGFFERFWSGNIDLKFENLDDSL